MNEQDPYQEAAVERWLLAYQEGKAPDGDCKIILTRMVRAAVNDALERAERVVTDYRVQWGDTGFAPVMVRQEIALAIRALKEP